LQQEDDAQTYRVGEGLEGLGEMFHVSCIKQILVLVKMDSPQAFYHT
jgi:hypothetical protein